MKALVRLLVNALRMLKGCRACFPATAGIALASAFAGSFPTTFVRAPYDVAVTNIRILSETPASATETDLSFAADLQNQDSGVYTNLSINVDATWPGLTYTVTAPILDFSTLPPAGVALAGTESLTARVNTADLASLRAQVVRSGDR